MKTIFGTLLVVVLFFVTGCRQQTQEKEAGSNEELYSRVMEIHDEVMPKMNDIYKKKEQLKDRLAKEPNLPEEERKEIEASIAELDSASEGMMRWMREFNPPSEESASEEEVREYLEKEMEKVKKVRDDILNALKDESGTEH